MPFFRIAELEIDPVEAGVYSRLLAEEIEAAVRMEPGVLFLFALAVKDCPHMVRVFEGYADQAAYESHLKTPHFLKYKTETAAMVRSLRLLEADAISLRAKGDHFSK